MQCRYVFQVIFLAEEIVNYFKVKKCSERHSCKEFGSRSRFSTAKSGLNEAIQELGKCTRFDQH